MAIYANVIQGFFSQEMSIPGEYALRPLGIEGVRVMHVEAACASSTIGLHVAVDYVRAGLADVVLVVGVEKLYSADRAKRFAVFQQPRDAEEARAYLDRTRGMLAPATARRGGAGPNIMMDAYAAQARLHMATYGTTPRQIAAVAAKNHAHSVHNPLAQYRDVMSIEEVLAAPLVAWPLTVPMCAPISDGAAAAIVCADEIHGPPPAGAAGARTGRRVAERPRPCARTTMPITSRRLTSPVPTKRPASGRTTSTSRKCTTPVRRARSCRCEALGLCAPATAAGAPSAARRRSAGGSRSTSRAGWCRKGIRSAPPGSGRSTSWCLQLRGDAGPRQVEGARIALAENSGGFYGVEDGLSAITILRRD